LLGGNTFIEAFMNELKRKDRLVYQFTSMTYRLLDVEIYRSNWFFQCSKVMYPRTQAYFL